MLNPVDIVLIVIVLLAALISAKKGFIWSVLNLGAGLATFVGPLLVGLFATPSTPVIGYTRVSWALAILYLCSSLMTWLFLKEKK